MHKTIFAIRVALIMSCTTGICHSEPSKECTSGLKLQDYEPNTIVFRKDDNDERNIDIKLSQMYPLFHNGCEYSDLSDLSWPFKPYFALTAQFGFYALGERESSPVIGKRFNPKLFFRHFLGDEGEHGYIDIGIAHESNGQSIQDETSFLAKQREYIDRGERAEFANDHISRGWDYLDLTLKLINEKSNYKTSQVYLMLKYFLEDGPFQGEPEEVYSWETDDPKSRSEVDGISLMWKSTKITDIFNSELKFSFLYTTGYENIIKNNTFKIEATFKHQKAPPIFVWYSDGYNADLTDYHKKVARYGIGFELVNFNL